MNGLKSRDGLVKRGQRVVALGVMQLVALAGIVGVAVILGAVLVSSAKAKGWLDGLVIGVVSVALTLLVMLSGRHVRRR